MTPVQPQQGECPGGRTVSAHENALTLQVVMRGRISASAKDKYIATDLSMFVVADIPNLAERHPGAKWWVSSFILSTMVRSNVGTPHRELAFHFLRRALISFAEHDAARSDTLAFLASDPSVYGLYFSALHHWEQCLSAAWHSIETLRLVLDLDTKTVFTRGDGSVEQRLHTLYTGGKHHETKISEGDAPPLGTVPVWLYNEGLRSKDAELTFIELANILDDLAVWAFALEDPLTSQDRMGDRRMRWCS